MSASKHSLPDIGKRQVLDYPISTVWQSVSTSDGISLWFVPNDFQPVEGHVFHVDMEKPQGRTRCQVTRIDAPYHLSFHVGEDWSWTFKLKDLGEKTELTFIWSGWAADKVTAFGMSHKTIHEQLIEGIHVLMKALARSVRKRVTQNKRIESGGENRMIQSELQVVGMSCANCVRAVETALSEIGVSGRINLKQGKVSIEYDESKVSLENVTDAIEDLGYDVV